MDVTYNAKSYFIQLLKKLYCLLPIFFIAIEAVSAVYSQLKQLIIRLGGKLSTGG